MSEMSSIIDLLHNSSKFKRHIVIHHEFNFAEVTHYLRNGKIHFPNCHKALKVTLTIALISFQPRVLSVWNNDPIRRVNNSFQNSVFVLYKFFCNDLWYFIYVISFTVFFSDLIFCFLFLTKFWLVIFLNLRKMNLSWFNICWFLQIEFIMHFVLSNVLYMHFLELLSLI